MIQEVTKIGMSKIGEMIKKCREDRGMTQDDLADNTGMARPTISRHERGVTTPSRRDRKAYADAFGFKSVDEFDDQWRATRAPQQIGDPDGIPVLSEIPAGNGDFDPTNMGTDNGIGYGYIPRKFVEMFTQDPLAYGLKVVGDSMEPNYYEGDIVICSPHAAHEPGMPAAIRFGSELENECTLKRVFKTKDNMLELRGDNNAHLPRIVDPEHVVRMDRVVAKISRAM